MIIVIFMIEFFLMIREIFFIFLFVEFYELLCVCDFSCDKLFFLNGLWKKRSHDFTIFVCFILYLQILLKNKFLV